MERKKSGLRVDRVRRATLVFAMLLLTLLAWHNRFIQDDAFISYRYAENLASGKGLTWNEGERVEGYTNFLWTVLIALGIALKLDPVAFSQTLGVISFVVTLFLVFKLSLLVLLSYRLALLVVVLLGTNYTFSAHATGGLETQFQTGLLLAATYVSFRIVRDGVWRARRLVAASLLMGASVLTRLDSSVYLAAIVIYILAAAFRLRVPGLKKAVHLVSLLLPGAAVVGVWFAWKIAYYGDILPNTYYVRATSDSLMTAVEQGVFYCYQFLISYWLIPFPFLAAFSIHRLARSAFPEMAVIALSLALWVLYVFKVGGDFMEFRFLVAVLPLFFVFVTWILFDVVQRREVRAALIACVLFGSLHHAYTFKTNKNRDWIQSVTELDGQIHREKWDEVGRILGDAFAGAPHPVTIATTACGAIPYYSRLKTIDMHGLSDKWVAKNGRIRGHRAGHQRIATFDYLLERGVNLVLSHPRVRPREWVYEAKHSIEDIKWFELPDARTDRVPHGARIVVIPLNEELKFVVLYLVQHPYIDEMIVSRGLETYAILD